jgi:hypothetical protein
MTFEAVLVNRLLSPQLFIAPPSIQLNFWLMSRHDLLHFQLTISDFPSNSVDP